MPSVRRTPTGEIAMPVRMIGRPKCRDSRPCFAKEKSLQRNYHGDYDNMCNVLTRSTYPDGECPFCKPKRDVTNGTAYPFSENYGRA